MKPLPYYIGGQAAPNQAMTQPQQVHTQCTPQPFPTITPLHYQQTQPYHILLASQAQGRPHPYVQAQAQAQMDPSVSFSSPLYPHVHSHPGPSQSLANHQHMSNSPDGHDIAGSAHELGLPRPRKPYTSTKVREMWSPSEHARMLEALRLYKRDWAKVTRHVGTRSPAQVRSHAQKYFDRLVRENSDEVVPQPRPKRKSTNPYPRKVRGVPANKGATEHNHISVQLHPQQNYLQNVSAMHFPVTVPPSPLSSTPYLAAPNVPGHVMTHLMSTPSPSAAAVMSPQMVSPYQSSITPGPTPVAGVPPTQIGFVNLPSPSLAGPMTPLVPGTAQPSPYNYGSGSPMTPYRHTFLQSPYEISPHMQVPSIQGPILTPPSLDRPYHVPNSVETPPQHAHVFVTPTHGHVLTAMQVPDTGLSAQSTVLAHAHPNGDDRNCAKCQALQRYGGVLNEIPALTAKRSGAEAGSDGKMDTASRNPGRHTSDVNDDRTGNTISVQRNDAPGSTHSKGIPVHSKRISKWHDKGQNRTARKEMITEQRGRSVEGESDSAHVDRATQEKGGATQDGNGIVSEDNHDGDEKSQSPSHSLRLAGDVGCDTAGKSCKAETYGDSGSGNDANGSSDIEPTKRLEKTNMTTRVDQYSSQERREIYDAVQSLQILAKRTKQP